MKLDAVPVIQGLVVTSPDGNDNVNAPNRPPIVIAVAIATVVGRVIGNWALVGTVTPVVVSTLNSGTFLGVKVSK